jgi:hypothetical protein
MKKTLTLAALLCAALSSTGCVSSYSPPTGDKAALLFHVYNDSTATMLMKGAIATAYDNQECENPAKLGSKLFMNAEDTLAPMQIASGTPFTFSIRTNDASAGTGNTGCTFTATFTPVANVAYDVHLATQEMGQVCQLAITNKKNEPVAFTAPEYSCDTTMKGIVRNGTGYWKTR